MPAVKPAQGEQHGPRGAAGQDRVGVPGEVAVDGAQPVVVFEGDGLPSVPGGGRLAGRQHRLEVSQPRGVGANKSPMSIRCSKEKIMSNTPSL